MRSQLRSARPDEGPRPIGEPMRIEARRQMQTRRDLGARDDEILRSPLRRRIAASLRLLAPALCLLSACADAPAPVAPPPPIAMSARISLREPLGHRWADEIIHADVDLPEGPGPVVAVDARGAIAPAEIEITAREGGRVHGRAWTVITLDPDAAATLELRPGDSRAAPGAVSVRDEAGAIVLANDRAEIAVPRWSATPDVRALPPPIRAIRRPPGAWVGEAAWTSESPAGVREAVTTVIARGPVRAAVEQRLRFADGTSYRALITLGARQEAARVVEDVDAAAPRAAYRLSLAGSTLWHNQWGAAPGAPSWGLVETGPARDRDEPVCNLRPWSFWWQPRLSEWAGFRAGDTLVGVIAIHPSRWTPAGWAGFDHTEIPVVARPSGRADLTFTLAASRDRPLHREWILSVAPAPREDTPAARARVLRAQLIKHGEFPLDEVQGWGFDAPIAARPHPSLIFDRAAVDRARLRAQTDPILAERVRAAVAYLQRCSDLEPALQKGGPPALYRAYAHHYLYETLPEAYLGTGDPRYGRLLAAAVEGLARRVVDLFLEAPERPALGAYGPWFTEDITRLVLNWDLVADLLPPDREAAVRRAMILGAHVLAHPDYWNPPVGLASANPNMTSSILLPRGLLGVALAGHPAAARLRREGEEELSREIEHWISPGGAWVENPGYQSASLDGIFLLGAALRRSGGPDMLADPRLRDTMDYYGSLLTAPDRRFAPKSAPPPMVLPSIGDMFSGWTTPFNGWMAAASAAQDPAFAARQQFYWRAQASMYGNAGRAKGFIAALTDPDLPASPPAETGRKFPGFGAVLRSSWTDPRQSYVAHRTGPNMEHYHGGETGSFVYYAKGAPLCLDWGNLYVPHTRGEPWYHNAVSFEDRAPARFGVSGEILDARSLTGFAAASLGRTRGTGGQVSDRSLLLVEDPDPLGPNYLIIRDHTSGGPPGQRFFWNLWCLAGPPEIHDSIAHFPGSMGVDLDAFILSPRAPTFSTDAWSWKQHIATWGDFSEAQHAIRVPKEGSSEDFFTVLYPRRGGERAPRVRSLAGGAAAWIDHAGGADVALLAPGEGASAREAGAVIEGEIALARRARGAIRLVVLARAGVSLGGWSLSSSGPAALEIRGAAVSGAASGDAHDVQITLPPGRAAAVVRVDGSITEARRADRTFTVSFPAGVHRFTISDR